MANEINLEENQPTQVDYNKLFSEENKAESNWFKFQKVGDKIAGKLINISEKEGDGNFEAQMVYTLETPTGELVKVGMRKSKDYVVSRITANQIGKVVGFAFVKEIPATKKGMNPAKSIEVYVM